MKNKLYLKAAFCAAAIIASGSTPATAGDLGVIGTTFEISEQDILSFISARLKQVEAEGRIDEMNRQFAAKVRAKVERPTPANIRTTTQPRSWLYDPTIVVDRDYSDHRGRVFARAGQRINPIERLPDFDRLLVFIDGDDERQVNWALGQSEAHGEHRTKIILTNGAPMELMRNRRRQFFFDQEARLVTHFNIQQVPATVAKEGTQMRVSEVKPW